MMDRGRLVGYGIWAVVLGGPILVGAYYKGWSGVREGVVCGWFGNCMVDISDGVRCRVREGRESQARDLARIAADETRPRAERETAAAKFRDVAGYDECYTARK